MVKDTRTGGSPDNGLGEIASGDNAPVPVVSQREEETMGLEMLVLDYADSGTVSCTVTLFDEEEGTARGDLSDMVGKFNLAPGEKFTLEEATFRDIEDDLIAYTEGNNDAVVIVTAGGQPVTG